MSPQLHSADYGGEDVLTGLRASHVVRDHSELHLATSMRSFRAEKLSDFVRLVLSREAKASREAFAELHGRYPIRLTRSLPAAKAWIRQQARGNERYGLVASSQAQRLKPLAVDVRPKINPVHWFLHDKADTRSSFYLEDVATEFQVQGLELDWTCVVWDADLRFAPEGWRHHEFRGSKWIRVKQAERQRYLENAYRVLLTRARQGMVLVVPEGDPEDATRSPLHYDQTFAYLTGIGIPQLA